MHSVCRRSIVGDFEFGQLLLASIPGRVWCGMAEGTLRDVMMMSIMCLVLNGFDELLSIDLVRCEAQPNSTFIGNPQKERV